MFEYNTNPEDGLSIDGQILDRVIEATKSEDLGDLETLIVIWEILNDAHDRRLI